MNVPELKNDGIVNDHKGYSLFNDVRDPSLQAWNRCNVINNIREAHGNSEAISYANALGQSGMNKVYFMFAYIKKHGWDNVSAEISRGKQK